MPTQRRYSFGQNDDFSLEHRLVTQLSAAMRQEEHDHHLNTDANGDQQSSTTTDPNSQLPDLSGLLGSLTSALGGGGATTAASQETNISAQPGNAKPAHQQHDMIHTAPDLGREAQHPGTQPLDLGSQLEANNINASSLLALLGPAVSSTQQHQHQHQQQHQQQDQQQHEHQLRQQPTESNVAPSHAAHASHFSHTGVSQTSTENSAKSTEVPGSDHSSSLQGIEGLNLDNLNSILAEARLPPSLPSHSTESTAPVGHSTGSSVDTTHRHRDLGLSDLSEFRSTSIDPEVSSIQSVLQMLLTGGSATQIGSGSSGAATTESESRTESSASGSSQIAGPPTLTTRLSGEQTETQTQPSSESTDYNALFGMGLGAEDQSLIESLRDAIGAASASSSSQGTAATSSSSSSLPSSSLSLSPSTDISGRIQKSSLPKPRQKSRSSVKYPLASSYKSYQSSDFNASDPETLRAIQQALLSALGPSAASTSLADSLTARTALPEGGAVLRRPSAELPIPASRRLHMDTANSASTLATTTDTGTTTTSRQPPSLLLPGKFPAQKPGALDKGSLATAGSRASPKPSKPAELDKQKQREENAARKRKWRELNHLQNRDRDLRLRIVKRAHELYGESDTAEKNTWIEQEFNRRRHRRILRAGIHSIVESARARALKARESGASVETGLERSSLGSARTLSQQSRQAASSHLSQLFRSSNAALEPQLHNEKLTVPLAPYMLVASPKRPPFKLQKLLKTVTATSKRPEEPANTNTILLQSSESSSTPGTAAPSSLATTTAKPPTAPAAASSSTELSSSKPTDSNTDKTLHTTDSEQKPSDTAAKDVETTADDGQREKSKPDLPKDTNTEKIISTSSSSPSNDNNTEKSNTGDETQKQKEESSAAVNESLSAKDQQKPEEVPAKTKKNDTPAADDAFAERPKHRYALVGNISFGVPPNLTALYKKIRGYTPEEKLLHKA